MARCRALRGPSTPSPRNKQRQGRAAKTDPRDADHRFVQRALYCHPQPRFKELDHADDLTVSDRPATVLRADVDAARNWTTRALCSFFDDRVWIGKNDPKMTGVPHGDRPASIHRHSELADLSGGQ